MDPQLHKAIADRIASGYTKEAIVNELVTAGYTTEQAESAYFGVVGKHPEVSQSAGALIGYWQLLKGSFLLCFQNKSVFATSILALVLTLVLSFAVVGVLLYAMVTEILLPTIAVAFGAILFITLPVMLALPGLALIKALLRRNERLPYWQAFSSLFSQLGSLALLIIVLALATTGGYFALVIPGIALSVYLLFSLAHFADTGTGTISALRGSYDLVYGRWWAVFGRYLFAILGMVLLFFVLLVPVFLLWSFISLSASGMSSSVGLFNQILIPFLIMIMFLLYLCFGLMWFASMVTLLYESLRATSTTPLVRGSWQSRFAFVIIGFVGLGLISYAIDVLDFYQEMSPALDRLM